MDKIPLFVKVLKTALTNVKDYDNIITRELTFVKPLFKSRTEVKCMAQITKETKIGELLQLDELQLAGKKRMSSKDFLNGNQAIEKMK